MIFSRAERITYSRINNFLSSVVFGTEKQMTTNTMIKEWYKEDLAYIHDVGFSDYALKSAPAILKILDQNKIRQGLK